MGTFYDYFNSGGRIWGRKGADPQADMSALEGEIDQLVAPRQLVGLSQ